MADIKKIIQMVKKFEGGYSNHPSDRGGCTMRGVCISTFCKYYGAEKTCEDLKHITDEQWLHIFRAGYWDRIKGDEIQSQSIANLFLDMAWGSGTVTAIRKVQACLGLTVDGVVGAKTLAALNGDGSTQYHKAVFEKLWEMRRLWFINISKVGSNKVFLKGWLNRLDKIKFED